MCRKKLSVNNKKTRFQQPYFYFYDAVYSGFFPVGDVPFCCIFHMHLCLVKTLSVRYFYLYTFCELEQNSGDQEGAWSTFCMRWPERVGVF